MGEIDGEEVVFASHIKKGEICEIGINLLRLVEGKSEFRYIINGDLEMKQKSMMSLFKTIVHEIAHCLTHNACCDNHHNLEFYETESKLWSYLIEKGVTTHRYSIPTYLRKICSLVKELKLETIPNNPRERKWVEDDLLKQDNTARARKRTKNSCDDRSLRTMNDNSSIEISINKRNTSEFIEQMDENYNASLKDDNFLLKTEELDYLNPTGVKRTSTGKSKKMNEGRQEMASEKKKQLKDRGPDSDPETAKCIEFVETISEKNRNTATLGFLGKAIARSQNSEEESKKKPTIEKESNKDQLNEVTSKRESYFSPEKKQSLDEHNFDKISLTDDEEEKNLDENNQKFSTTNSPAEKRKNIGEEVDKFPLKKNGSLRKKQKKRKKGGTCFTSDKNQRRAKAGILHHLHDHPLKLSNKKGAWACDGCTKDQIFPFSEDDRRYSCCLNKKIPCDFDLCEKCYKNNDYQRDKILKSQATPPKNINNSTKGGDGKLSSFRTKKKEDYSAISDDQLSYNESLTSTFPITFKRANAKGKFHSVTVIIGRGNLTLFSTLRDAMMEAKVLDTEKLLFRSKTKSFIMDVKDDNHDEPMAITIEAAKRYQILHLFNIESKRKVVTVKDMIEIDEDDIYIDF